MFSMGFRETFFATGLLTVTTLDQLFQNLVVNIVPEACATSVAKQMFVILSRLPDIATAETAKYLV